MPNLRDQSSNGYDAGMRIEGMDSVRGFCVQENDKIISIIAMIEGRGLRWMRSVNNSFARGQMIQD